MSNLDYLYNPDAAKRFFGKNYFIDKKLDFQVIEQGTILPHKKQIEGLPPNNWGFAGVVDRNGTFINSCVLSPHCVSKSYTPPPESIQHSSETVIYLGMFFPVWGHCFTDNIRRVWFLKSDIFEKEFKNCRIVYIPLIPMKDMSDPSNESFKRLLEILEVDVDKLQPITQPTQFDKIIIPDDSYSYYFTNEYREIIDRVRNFALKNRTPISSKKLYFFYGKNQVGEERMAEYLKSKGYEIITHAQRSNFDEEINMLINCESFAAPLGSCSHNSIFLRDGTEAIFIPRTFTFTNYQESLNQVNSLNANYVNSTLSIFFRYSNKYCYIISPQLKKFFGDDFNGYEEEDFKAFLQYVKSCTNSGLEYDSKIYEYHGSMISDFLSQLKRHEDLIKAYDMPFGWEKFRPLLTYQTHIHMKGWSDGWKSEDQVSNNINLDLDIQAIKINFPNHKLYCSVYYNKKEGWSEEVMAPEIAGTPGKRKPIYGIRIWLDEAGTKEFDILYRVHKFDGDWTTWAKNGEVLYSYGVKLNSIQIKLEPK